MKARSRTSGLSRRSLLATASAAAALPLFGARPAMAQSGDFVVSSFGGKLGDFIRDDLLAAYSGASGLTGRDDPSGPLAGRIRAMVEAENVTWDICDSVAFTAIALGRQGFLEPIDPAVVDPATLLPDSVFEHGINYGYYSVVLAYDTAVFGDAPPTSWADLFDLVKFPGRRVMWKYGYSWEAALLADGVAPDALYPLDTERAIAKFATIRDETIFVESGSEGIAALRDGEAVMGVFFSYEAANGAATTDGRIAWTWNQGLKGPMTWVVPKGAPAGSDAAMAFIALSLSPEMQAAMAEKVGVGPALKSVSDGLPPEVQQFNPNYPEWAATQITWNVEYHAEMEEELIGLFLDRVAAG